jgi:hypothetical protein
MAGELGWLLAPFDLSLTEDNARAECGSWFNSFALA